MVRQLSCRSPFDLSETQKKWQVKGDGDPLGGLPLSLAQTAPPARATTKSPGGSGRCASGMAVLGGEWRGKQEKKIQIKIKRFRFIPFFLISLPAFISFLPFSPISCVSHFPTVLYFCCCLWLCFFFLRLFGQLTVFRNKCYCCQPVFCCCKILRAPLRPSLYRSLSRLFLACSLCIATKSWFILDLESDKKHTAKSANLSVKMCRWINTNVDLKANVKKS